MVKNNIHKITAWLILIILWGGIYARIEYQKTIISPGNPVLFHGKLYDIDLMEIDGKTDKSRVQLKGINFMIPADSVSNPYRPFWRL